MAPFANIIWFTPLYICWQHFNFWWKISSVSDKPIQRLCNLKFVCPISEGEIIYKKTFKIK